MENLFSMFSVKPGIDDRCFGNISEKNIVTFAKKTFSRVKKTPQNT